MARIILCMYLANERWSYNVTPSLMAHTQNYPCLRGIDWFIPLFTWGQIWPSGFVVACICLPVYSISQEICTRFLLCCGYTLTDFPISIRLTSLALWQSNDCPSASKATLMNMDKYFMWIHYERLHNHNKAKHNKTVCIFLGIYCIDWFVPLFTWGQTWPSGFIVACICLPVCPCVL